VAKIKVLRHKLFAHRDHGMGYNDVFKAAQVRPDDVKAIFDESFAIVNGLAALTGAQGDAFEHQRRRPHGGIQ
jgi:hypothetical protein